MVYLVGIVINFFLAFVLLTKRNKSSADKILFTWLCAILLHLLLFAGISSGKYLQFPFLLGLEIPLPLLHGPFLYLYTRALTRADMSLRKNLLHFLPYALALVSTIPFVLSAPGEKIRTYQNGGEGYTLFSYILFSGVLISGVTYIALSLRLLRTHRKYVKDNYSYSEKVNLSWLFRLIIGLSLIWVLVFIADDAIIFSSVVLFVLFIGYYGIKHAGIFANQPSVASFSAQDEQAQADPPDIASEQSKYEKTYLAPDKLEILHRDLVQLMESKKLYLTAELSLAMVAGELNVHPNVLSQVINRAEQKTFFDYINALRVREFTERAMDPANQKYTLLSLALDCGFNSKTSFNRNFKNLTGKSPSEYVKDLRDD